MATILFLLALVAACVVGIGLAVLLAVTARPGATLSSEVASARRHSVLVSGLATAFGCAGLVATLTARSLLAPSSLQANRLLGVLPLVAAAVALLVLWVGELTWPRPTGAVRTALLQVRSALTVADGRWPRAALLVAGLLTGSCLVTGLLADADGRTFSRSFDGGESSVTPFPGWFYGLPQLAALACCVVLTAVVLAAVARRPAVVTADLDTDRLLRRASAARACRVLVFACLLTLAGDFGTAGGAVSSVVHEGPGRLLGGVVFVAAPLALLAAVVVAFLPVPRLARVPDYASV